MAQNNQDQNQGIKSAASQRAEVPQRCPKCGSDDPARRDCRAPLPTKENPSGFHPANLPCCPECDHEFHAGESAEVPAAAPVHPIEVRISIGGDDWAYVQRILRELAGESEHRNPSNFQMFGGGAGGSYSVTVAERNISIADFHEELQTWHENQ